MNLLCNDLIKTKYIYEFYVMILQIECTKMNLLGNDFSQICKIDGTKMTN